MTGKKRVFAFAIFASGIFLLLAIFVAQTPSALNPSYCCEKTTSGAWCQNADDINKCSTGNGLRAVPTSCDATSYCKPGTCVNTQDGVCMENTPQRVCENPVGGKTAGKWYDKASDSVPQCQLGCCLIGDQAAFTTQTRCKQLSSLYGLETNYRTDINTETACIASANPDVKGACVFEADFEKSCKFGARSECQTLEKSSGNSNTTFYPNFLCSAEELGTNCGPSKQTTVFAGRDEVYFLDTCGNQANIYDASRATDKKYWDKIVSKADSCALSSANTQSCGNCDYLLGSVGKVYDMGVDPKAPQLGSNICRNLDCNFEGNTYKHGETWCAQSGGTSTITVQNGNIVDRNVNNEMENVPGSRYYRMVCYNGDVTTEPCADFRAEVCLQSSIPTTSGEFRTAACHVNRWQDCANIVPASGSSDDIVAAQNDCQDSTVRDCVWEKSSITISKTSGGILGIGTTSKSTTSISGKCVPKYAPGFDFWSGKTDSVQLCSQASETCTVKLEKKIVDLNNLGSGNQWICKGGCECIDKKEGDSFSSDDLKNINSNWVKERNNICSAIGDCGVKINFVNQKGKLVLGDLFRGG